MANRRGRVSRAKLRISSRRQKRVFKRKTCSAAFEMLESRVLLNSDPIIIEHVVFGRSDVKLEENVELISGVLGSDGKIQVEEGSSTKSVFAGSEIEIKKNAVVDGPILGGGDVKLEENSQALGSIDAGQGFHVGLSKP